MVTATVGELGEAVGELTVAPVSADVVELFGLRERVEVTVLEALCGFFASGGHDVDGFRSAVGWLKAHVALTDGDAKALAVRAKRLAVWPTLAKLLFDGSLAPAQVAVVVSSVPRDLVEVFAAHDEEVSALLVGLCVGDTRTAIDRWVTLARDTDSGDEPVDPDDTTVDGFVHLSRYGADDRGRLDGDLGPDATAIVDAALTAADAALTAARGTDAEAEAGIRVGSQRRADALVEVCRFYTDHTDCDTHRRARTPQLMALMEMPEMYRAALYGAGIHHPGDLDRFLTARRLAGQPVSAVEEAFLRHALDHATGRAVTIDGHHLSPEAVTTIFGAGTTLERVMLADSQVLDHGRQVRLAAGPLRDAMLARDGGCRFPTPTGERCDAPVTWINGHHITHWKRGGPTAIGNLIALCSNHHGVVHRHGWDITIDTHGTVTLTRPDGTTLTSPPPHTRRPPRLPLHRDDHPAGTFDAGPHADPDHGFAEGDDQEDDDPGVCGWDRTQLALTLRLPEPRSDRSPLSGAGSVDEIAGTAAAGTAGAPPSVPDADGATGSRRPVVAMSAGADAGPDHGAAPPLPPCGAARSNRLRPSRTRARRPHRGPDFVFHDDDGTPLAVFVTAA